MRKRTKILSIIAIMLIVGAVGLSISKYVHNESNNVSEDIALWNVSASSSAITNTNYDATTITANKMAPGTEGYFDLGITATNTNVGVDYIVTLTDLQHKPANLYFYIDDDESIKYTDLDSLGSALSGTINANADNKTISKRIHWKWPYTTTTSVDGTRTTLAANNEQDTIDGKNSTSLSFTVNIEASQVEPTQN